MACLAIVTSKGPVVWPFIKGVLNEVLVPNQKHPSVVKIAGDAVTTAPPISVLILDEIVVQTFLKLSRKEVTVSEKFEAELNREDLRTRRGYDPEDSSRYPDLLITLNGSEENKKIALEVELSVLHQ